MSNGSDLKEKRAKRLPASRTGKTIAFLGMVIGTAGTGAVIAFLAAFISGLVMRGWNIGFASLGILLLLMILGYLAGVIVGIVLTDKVFHYRGSLLFAIPGSIMGTGLVFVLAADPLNLDPAISILFTCLFLFPPLLGTTGFHLGRKRNS
ncbi:MAG TPA: hypothetical protein G4O07_07345 [Dehalococcoidia bacterium]|nr:hypothetical protein [Dehalococcoidia bacterium]